MDADPQQRDEGEREDHEFLRALLVRESATPQTDADDVAAAIIRAGFTRPREQQQGETEALLRDALKLRADAMAVLTRERDEAQAEREAGIAHYNALRAERDALAAKLFVTTAALERIESLAKQSTEQTATAIARAEAAEASGRDWRKRCDRANDRATALAEALREIEAHGLRADGATCARIAHAALRAANATTPAVVTADDITEAQAEAFRCEFNRGITFDGKPFLYANDVTIRSIQAAIAAALAAAKA